MGTEARLRRGDRRRDRFEVRIGPESEFSALGLGCAWWTFVEVLDLMHEICDLPPDALKKTGRAEKDAALAW
jgi:hypothetical protein